MKLTFPEDLVTEPVLGRMVRTFDVLPNIRRASVEEGMGWIVCELDGERGVVEQAIGWLVEQGVEVERLDGLVEG